MTHGGYREGSGRAKCGYYKGIYCGSTYELAWVIFQLDNNKKFDRFPGFVEADGKKYFPDFLQDGKIVEIKGYEVADKVDAKTTIANKNGYEVVVLRKADLKEQFLWVEEKYKTKKFHTLYDEYKPQYAYKCACCGVDFFKDKKSKFEKTFCSRACSLKGNRKVSGHNQYTLR